MRIFAADASAQQPTASGAAPLLLAGDDRGMPLGAVRLVAYHYKGHYLPPDPSRGEDTHLRFGALIKAAAVPSPGEGPRVVAALLGSLAAAELDARETEVDGSRLWSVSARASMSSSAHLH